MSFLNSLSFMPTFSPVFGWIGSLVVVVLVLATCVWLTVRFVRATSVRTTAVRASSEHATADAAPDTASGAAARTSSTDMTRGMLARRWTLGVLLCIMLLGPSTYASTTTRAVNATDVFVAADVTGSMAVSDAQYGTYGSSSGSSRATGSSSASGSAQTLTRIAAARQAVYDIADHYPDASFSAVTFGASASVTLPLTPDHMALTSWADSLATEPTNVSSGSSLDAPLNTLITALKAARDAHPQDTIILYILTDGEQTTGEAVKSFSVLRPYITNAVVVGLGSAEGGRIPQTSTGIRASASASEVQQSTQSWIQDPDTGADGISQMNESNLKTIADQLSGSYIHPDAQTTLKTALSSDSSDKYRLVTTTRTLQRPVSLLWPFGLVFALVALWELSSWTAVSRKLFIL